MRLEKMKTMNFTIEEICVLDNPRIHSVELRCVGEDSKTYYVLLSYLALRDITGFKGCISTTPVDHTGAKIYTPDDLYNQDHTRITLHYYRSNTIEDKYVIARQDLVYYYYLILDSIKFKKREMRSENKANKEVITKSYKIEKIYFVDNVIFPEEPITIIHCRCKDDDQDCITLKRIPSSYYSFNHVNHKGYVFTDSDNPLYAESYDGSVLKDIANIEIEYRTSGTPTDKNELNISDQTSSDIIILYTTISDILEDFEPEIIIRRF